MKNKMKLELRTAKLSDIDNVLKLHYRYQVDSISDEDKGDGFVTTPFTKQELSQLITQENGLFIALKDDEIVAYVMAASWQYWSVWPMFAHMIKDLNNLEYSGQTLSVKNSYQYGPICIDKCVRGTGALEKIFDFALKAMSKRYPVLVTFVNKNNPRSMKAHIEKLKLDTIQEFEYNDNHYVELACETTRI